MAINLTPLTTKLKMQFDGGLDGDGKQIVKSKTYSKVKPTASNEDIYAVATSLASVQSLPIVSVRRLEEVELTEEV